MFDQTSHRVHRLAALLAVSLLLVGACSDDDDTLSDEGPAAEPEQEPATEEDEEGDLEDEVADHSFEDGDEITVVIGTPPGGGFDLQATLLLPGFEEALREITGVDVSMRTEYMPGGGHLVALQHVERSEPDGKTLIYGLANNGIGHQMIAGEDLNFAEFTPLGTVTMAPVVFTASTDLLNSLPTRDFEGLVNRSNQESIIIGVPGTPAQYDMMVGLLAENGIDLNLQIVSVEGAAGATTSLLSGEVEIGAIAPTGIAPYVEDNPDDLDFLVHTGCERDAAIPDVPTIVDWGVPEAQTICDDLFSDWRAIYGPPGISEGNARVLSAALQRVIESQDFYDQLYEISGGSEARWLGMEEMRNMMRTRAQTWQHLSRYVD